MKFVVNNIEGNIFRLVFNWLVSGHSKHSDNEYTKINVLMTVDILIIWSSFFPDALEKPDSKLLGASPLMKNTQDVDIKI